MGVCLDPDHTGVVTEYMDGGDLRQLLRAWRAAHSEDGLAYPYPAPSSPLAPLAFASRKTRVRILLEAGIGLQYLHSLGFPHRDIKPSNILLEGRMFPVKLADFGMSGPKAALSGGGGTPRYSAPEVLLGAQADAASDVFSFGVVVYEVLTTTKPCLRGRNAFASPVAEPAHLETPSLIPAHTAALLSAMLAPEPADRPSMATVCEALVALHDSLWAAPAPILLVPDDIVLRIFGFVPLRQRASLRAVCRAWRAITESHALWAPDLDEALVVDSDERIQLLLRAPYLGVAHWLFGLTSLKVGRHVSDTGLHILASFCVQLVELDLSPALLVSDLGVRDIVSSLTDLTDLDLSECKHLSDRALQYVGESCASLTKLNLDSCVAMTSAGIKHLAIGCPDLRIVCLAGIATMGDPALLFLASCVGLSEIDVSGCAAVTDVGLSALAASCVLTTVIATACPNLTSRGVREVLEYSANLRVAIFNDCPDVGSDAFADYVPPRLRHLSLAGCRRVGNSALRLLPPTLELLSISSCTRINAVGYASLAELGLTALEALSLRRTSVTDTQLEPLLVSTAGALCSLDLTQALKIGDAGLHAISQAAPHLRRLALGGCHRISNDGLRFLTRGCTQLTELFWTAVPRSTTLAWHISQT
ncbi:TKL protein kinase [Thecamonas trahens ATCC 50062]|uniref:TKL protein kinase n=1 Tax=Thecamonas trahens ATCC 50062 TaxID=461836 RepID=A0A0L0DKU6_THETB|nr:TKL protein kinase [Thecamonas trahens ATCC 50062]KNC52855.1 TKL protein kinase [Thecamonas trahens ATCC 50062]|eukprot:XP_013754957.1 TKL protein kinase [Thecamonas trahens ATCC 50062]